jgi:hypothetical protein
VDRFCNVRTNFGGHKHNASADVGGALKLTVRHTHGQNHHYPGFKVALSSPGAARHHGGHELFGMYKSDFHSHDAPEGKDGWKVITIPFRDFSSDWSDFTGECDTKDPDGYQHKCCKTENEAVCPTAKAFSELNGLSIWAEGAEGGFALQIKQISAVRKE